MAFHRVVDGIEDNGHVFRFNVEDTTAKTSTVTSLGSKTLNGNDILFLVYKSHTVNCIDQLGHCIFVLMQGLVR